MNAIVLLILLVDLKWMYRFKSSFHLTVFWSLWKKHRSLVIKNSKASVCSHDKTLQRFSVLLLLIVFLKIPGQDQDGMSVSGAGEVRDLLTFVIYSK